jgi:hypothetical protein
MRANYIFSTMQTSKLLERSAGYRRLAARLAYAAETLGDAVPCRDIGAERERLRRASAQAAERARLLARHGACQGRAHRGR